MIAVALIVGMVGCNGGGIIEHYDLTISSTIGGLVIEPGEETFTYDEGTEVTLKAVPDEGYRFVEWIGDVENLRDVNAPETIITIWANSQIQAIFEAICLLNIASTAGGNVTAPGEGIFFYGSGAVVNLVATPDAGYHFVNWTGDVDTIVDIWNPTTDITMNKSKGIVANFAAGYALRIFGSNGGSVTVPGEGTFSYDPGTVVNLVATPTKAGYHFRNWTGDVGTIADVNSAATNITMSGDYYVRAKFEVTPMVAAGGAHTVVLKSDGTVVAVGNNNYGQLNTGNWTDIIQVAAGWADPGFFEGTTVGLCSNGTVVATGRNIEKQCEVGGWTDIIQVAASPYHTVGLRANGTVVATGAEGLIDYGQLNVTGWTNITQVAAGGHHTVGLCSNGTVVAVGDNSSGQRNVDNWTDIIQVAAGSHHTVGLCSNGTLVATGCGMWPGNPCDVGGWTDIIQVAAGGNHTVGLYSNTTVVATGYNYAGQCNVGSWNFIIQVAAGHDHTVGLRLDLSGSIPVVTAVAVGDNFWGQLNVGGWVLN